jgi:hypothetical protein
MIATHLSPTAARVSGHRIVLEHKRRKPASRKQRNGDFLRLIIAFPSGSEMAVVWHGHETADTSIRERSVFVAGEYAR